MEPELEAVADTIQRTHPGASLEATIRPSRHDPDRPLPGTSTLPQMRVAPKGAAPKEATELDLGPILGEGGMGIVRLAVQTPLARDVAVKSLKPAALSANAQVSLIEEAMITGALEHPNIIPIHTLGKDATGAPLLVMKRIEGVSWRRLLQDPKHPAWERVKGDRLVWNLEILMQVSNAVHFAHSKHVVHRDLKPENVMIGSYGEVYVLDWGIAIRLEDPPKRHAAEGTADAVAGTPGYMAPEMATGQISQISPRTDVYLLGAMLHEILTGHPRHRGTMIQALYSAYRSEPFEYDASVPKPLAAIANRAMSANLADRYESAEAFKEAVAAFLRQRSSILLSDEASERLAALNALLSAPERRSAQLPGPGKRSEAQRTAARSEARSEAEPSEVLGPEASPDPIVIYKLYGECRFGFQHALRTSNENPAAVAGLAACIERMAEYELSRRNPKAAAVLIAELERPRAELVERLRALERELEGQAAEMEKLRRMERDIDVTVGSKTRAVLAVSVGVAFNLAVLVWLYSREAAGLTVEHTIAIAAAFLASVLLALWIARRTVLQNAANRRLAWALAVAASAMFLHRLSALQIGTPVDSVFTEDLLILATSGGTVAATLDSRFTWVSVYLAAITFVVAAWPATLMYSFPIAATAGVGILALSWRIGTGTRV
jgi:eukaryotic-like serine/threonine-protein kinase